MDKSAFELPWQQAFEFVEATLGGRIISVERQERWRTAFYINVEVPGGGVTPVYYRGARDQDTGGLNIRHEYNILCALEKNGIEVPKLYGFCEEPAGIVMAWVHGKFDLEKNAANDAEVNAVMQHYMEIMARVHQGPIDDFVAAGIPALSTAEELAWGDTTEIVAHFRNAQTRPEPGIDFMLDWLARNPPAVSGKAAFILGDSGQFLFDKERVTAIIDVELGYIGDPAADLAGLFVRDVSEPLGDIGHAIDHYDQCMGRPVNRRAVMYHAIRWGLSTPLHVANMIARPPRSLEYIQYLGWYLVYQRTPLQQIAYLENIELEEPATPEAMTTPYSVAHDALLDRLQGFKTNSDTQAYDLDRLIRLQQYLHRADRYGPDVDRQALDEAQEILGTRPTSLLQCDQLLVEFIAGSAGESDADLVQYFYRRFRRQEFLLKGVLRELEGASVQMLEL